MKMLTAKDLKNLPPLRSTENDRDPVAWVKFFRGPGTWFLTEYDPETGEGFGYVMGLGGDELGYINVRELQRARVERDMYYKPMKLSKAKQMQRKAHGYESEIPMKMSKLIERVESMQLGAMIADTQEMVSELGEATKASFDKSIEKIAQMTDDNDHHGAIKEAAKLLGNKKIEKVAGFMSQIQMTLGHTPYEMIQLRNSLWKTLDETAKKKLSPEDFDSYKSAG